MDDNKKSQQGCSGWWTGSNDFALVSSGVADDLLFCLCNIEDVVVELSLEDPSDLVSQSHDEVTVLFRKKVLELREYPRVEPILPRDG